jgi:putative ABC transport system permease protein
MSGYPVVRQELSVQSPPLVGVIASAALVRMILGEGVLLIGCGVVFGYVLAAALGRYFSALLYNFSAADPLIDLAVTAVLIPSALIAMYLPARRASKVDPMIALRYD